MLVYSGKYAYPFSIDNDTFSNAIRHKPLDGHGALFRSWVTAYYCESTVKVDNAKRIYEDENYKFDDVKKKWNKKLDNIRHKNIFKKMLYNLSKKYLFPSINESFALDIDFLEKSINYFESLNDFFDSDLYTKDEKYKSAKWIYKKILVDNKDTILKKDIEDYQFIEIIKEKLKDKVNLYNKLLINYYKWI